VRRSRSRRTEQSGGYPSPPSSVSPLSVSAVSAAIGLIWRIKVSHAVAASCAPIGASFTVCALVTGSLWGRPMWGTYWEWDPRLTSELILLFLYLGYMGLRSATEDPQRADRISAVLAIVGGNAAILAGSRIVSGWHRKVSVALAAFGLLSFALFVFELTASSALPLGALERCSVYSITAWQLLMAAWLLSRRPTL